MRFVDLFSGLGGFHLALRSFGHECVFACEIDSELRATYKGNFDIISHGDIRYVPLDSVPEHDILCAGFPCQPFSKAGSQQGFKHPRWGDLFEYVLKIIEHRQPRYLMLENVPHLERHNKGETWQRIQGQLVAAGYDVQKQRLSPHRFGIPQVRERLFIVAVRETSGLRHFRWPEVQVGEPSLDGVLRCRPRDAKQISPKVQECLTVWQDFLERFPADEKLPWIPIWSMEFGATYPYEDTTPHAIGTERLRDYLGAHGRPLKEEPADSIMNALPSYARRPDMKFPPWKVAFIRKNRELYARHKDWIDEWKESILKFPSSYQKLEWNCQGEDRNIWRYIIQFRASGVRVKRPTTAPSLIAMTDTQVPIVAWEKRYMTPRECARLQSMDELRKLPESTAKAYAALGNAVNVKLVRWVAERLLCSGDTLTVTTLHDAYSAAGLSFGGSTGGVKICTP
jgi:DNA (cytosine-5)-methyltransferase 1